MSTGNGLNSLLEQLGVESDSVDLLKLPNPRLAKFGEAIIATTKLLAWCTVASAAIVASTWGALQPVLSEISEFKPSSPFNLENSGISPEAIDIALGIESQPGSYWANASIYYSRKNDAKQSHVYRIDDPILSSAGGVLQIVGCDSKEYSDDTSYGPVSVPLESVFTNIDNFATTSSVVHTQSIDYSTLSAACYDRSNNQKIGDISYVGPGTVGDYLGESQDTLPIGVLEQLASEKQIS